MSLLFACGINRFSHDAAVNIVTAPCLDAVADKHR